MALGEYLGAGSGTTKGLYHLNGNANDSSGNANNGTATNVTWVGGKIGSGAGSFNGTSSISMGDVLDMASDQVFTMGAWVYRTTTGTMPVISKGGYQTQGYALYITTTANQGLYFNGQGEVYGGTISADTWNHVLVTRGNHVGGMNAYINGAKVATAEVNHQSGSNAVSLYIGYIGDSFNKYFTGNIDEVIIEFGKEWTASEVRKYYTYSKGRFGIT